MKLAHKVVIAISIPVVFQIGFFWFVLDSVRKLDQLEQKVRDATEVLMMRDKLYIAEGQQLLFYGIYRATLNPVYVKKFEECARKGDDAYHELFRLWADSKVRMHILHLGFRQHQTYSGYGRQMVGCEKQKTMFNLLSGPTALPLGPFMMVNNGEGSLELAFREVEHSQPELKKEAQVMERQLEQLLLEGLAAFVLISVASGLLFSREITDRLNKVVRNIKTIEAHESDLVRVGGGDEIAALNDAILDTNEKIRAAEEFQAQTARIVAQELQRPIDSLSVSLSELLNSGFETLNDNGRERIDRSAMELARLRTLVKDLVSLDKISRAGWDLEIKKVDLAEITRGAVDTVKDFASSLQVELVCELSESYVLGDPARLQQIALNLLTNAIKFSKPNKTIEIETKVEGGFGRLAVTDHGTGIPEEFQQSIFGKFEQVSRTDSTEKGGSGLGLAISKKLVESQHGKMGLRSELGSGSSFWILLPLSNSETASGEARAASGDLIAVAVPGKMQGFRPTLGRKVLALATAPLLVQVLTIASLWLVVGSIRDNVNEFYRASQIASYHSGVLNALLRGTCDAMLVNAYQFPKFIAVTKREQKLAVDLLEKLSEVTQSNDVLRANFADLKRHVRENIELQYDIMRAPKDADIERWFGPTVCVKHEQLINELEQPLQSAIAYESKLVEGNIFAKMSYRKNVEAVLFLSMLFMFLLSAAMGILLTRRLTLRVDKIVANSERLVAKQPLHDPLDGTDEVAYVDHSFFNAASKLIQLERFKQEIIGITSHEFRTPLTSLLAKTDLMEAGVFGTLTDRGKKIVDEAKRSITDLIALITNLLDVEKIQSGKNIVEKADVSIDALLGELVENLLEIARQREVELIMNSNPLMVMVRADSARLVQALRAVIYDMIAHAPAKTSIFLDAKVEASRISISIAAPGAECSKNALDVATARGRLAVDLIKLIAEQHSGSCEVQSNAEELRVTIRLPIR